MLVKNLTPFFHGAKITSRRGRQLEMSFVVRGTFRLVQGGVVEAVESLDQGLMTGEVYGDDDPERAFELLYPGDFADMKPTGEVLLRGTCHAPGGKPTGESSAGLSVGSWRKDVAVFGDRRWDHTAILGSKPTEPRPFRSMPLTWTRAFGGIGNPANPVGRSAEQGLLPNVELLEAPIRGRSDAPKPAGLGPINPSWSPRAGLVGTRYDRAWLAQRAPWLAEDLDWRWFQAAPRDQQLDAYLRGDEKLVLRNLHPEHAVLETRLPALRLRVLVKDDRAKLREVGMVLDTLFVDADAGVVYLTWRGLDPVREDDLADVATVLVASEPLASAPQPLAVYREQLEAFEKDPTGALAAMPAGLLEAAAREEDRRRGGDPAPAEVPPGLDPVSREMKGRLGPLMSDEQLASTREAMAKAQQVPPGSAPLDLDKAVADARAAERREAPTARVIKPGRLPDTRLREKMRLVLAEVDRLRADEKRTGRAIDGLDAMAAVPHEPRWKEIDPEYEPPGPLSTDAPGPGADLRDRDFAEQDLAGIDLTGAKLDRANFTRANLRGARLAGASLRRAILYLADLGDADLVGADLSLANAAFVRAPGADFTRATLDEAFLEGADLSKAKLDGVAATYVVLEEANLAGASLRGARLDHGDLTRAKLDGAVMTEASATLCLFAGCSAVKTQLGGATLRQASFADADLTGAVLVGAQAPTALFAKTRLGGADLSFAELTGAHFTDAHAARAKFHGANLREARFYRADLTLADLGRANLMSADLRKVTLESTKLVGANLYEAKFLGVRGGGWDVADANLKRSVWDGA